MIARDDSGFLRGALLRFEEAPALLRSTPSKTRMERAAKKIEVTFGDLTPKPPAQFDLDALLLRITHAWALRNMAILTRREVRMAPYVFFYPNKEPKSWLGIDAAFLTAYDRQAIGSDSARATVALLYEFIKWCKPELPTYNRIRLMTYRRLFHDEPSVRLNRWRERCAKFRLLDDDNHKALLSRWRELDEPSVPEYLKEAGLSPGLDDSELVRRTTLEVLRETREFLEGGAGVQAVQSATAWLTLGGRLRFETLRKEIAAALLGPFVSQRPNAETSAALRAFFLAQFGDPRTAGIRGWAGIPEEHRRVILRILVGLTLEDFFRLLDKTADKQWRFRKAFWSAYEKRGAILDAWVALGPRAQEYAGSELRKSSADVGGAGVQGNQSVLLMQFGGLTIAEWSHNGSCRFWLPGNRSKPTLYKSYYSAANLRASADPDEEIRHVGSENGAWQERIASFIHRHTGMRLLHHQYMPRGH